MEKKTRSPRAPKPPTSYSGMTADQWRADAAHLEWAQRNPIFGELVAVMTNGRAASFLPCEGATENRMLGRLEGYQLALDVLMTLTQGHQKPVNHPEPTYLRDEPEMPQPTD